MTDFLRDPALPAALDLSTVAPSLLADAPDRLLGLAADLLLSGDTARGGEYLDLLERAQPPIPPESRLAARFAAMRSFHYGLTGQLNEAVGEALAARAIQERTQLTDEWNAAVPLILLRVYTCLEDFKAVEREAAAALAMPGLTEPAKLVLVPSAQALAWFEAGRLAEAADAARAAAAEAQRLGFDQHFFAVDYLRVLAGLALEQRDLDTAEQLTEQALSITERRRPLFEFLALLDRAGIWAARGQVREALATVKAARHVLAGTRSVLLARADELEALLRLSLGDLHSPAELASGLPAARRGLLLARIALAAGDHQAAQRTPAVLALGDLTPRRALIRQLLLAAAAIERGDPMAASILGGALQTARRGGLPQHGRHDRAPGDELPIRAFGAAAAGPVHRAADRRGSRGARRAARRLPVPPRARRAPDRCRVAHPEAPADQHLPADGRHSLHFAQHGKDPPPVDLPEARRGVTLGGHRAGSRPAPALRPSHRVGRRCLGRRKPPGMAEGSPPSG